MSKPTFDKEKVHDEQISPLVNQIIAICKEHQIPMLATFCYANDPAADDDNTKYCTTALPGPENFWPEEISEAKHIIRSGASTRPKMVALTITTKP